MKKLKIFLLVGLSILLASLYLAQLENIIVAVGTEGPDIFDVSDPTKSKASVASLFNRCRTRCGCLCKR
ncbi:MULTISPECIES: hypothetical protein [unclassified Petrotoga]|jgi:hypothetical protein|uniref:hypothetical protein n=1 Tax=unclassified Petrotoga TaxID=2620614 RepID=UPI0018F65BF9|nr:MULTISPECIES: hypothetical protein [unclassified Petrotoga]